MAPFESDNGIRPFLVQQSSSDCAPDLVATDIGRGGIFSTSTKRSKIPVIHMLAPPSINDGLSSAVVLKTLTHDPSSPRRPQTRGRPTTLVTLVIAVRCDLTSSVNTECVANGTSKGNSNRVTGDDGRINIPGSIIDPCGSGIGGGGRAFSNGTPYSTRPFLGDIDLGCRFSCGITSLNTVAIRRTSSVGAIVVTVSPVRSPSGRQVTLSVEAVCEGGGSGGGRPYAPASLVCPDHVESI